MNVLLKSDLRTLWEANWDFALGKREARTTIAPIVNGERAVNYVIFPLFISCIMLLGNLRILEGITKGKNFPWR